LLLGLGAFLLTLFVLSDAVLTHSRSFWRFCKRGGFAGMTAPLVVEASLSLAAPGRSDVIVTGSSVVERDINAAEVAAASHLPVDRLLKLPLFGGSSLEIAMLTRRLVALRPRVVVYLATPWTLQNKIDWDLLRFYDPLVAVDVLSWSEILAEHATHAAGLLSASHVVIRHRSSLRTALFRPLLAATAGGPVHAPRAREAGRRAWKERYAARRGDFACDNINARSLDAMARRLSDAGISFVVVSTPVSGRWGRDPELVGFVDDCLASRARAQRFVFLSRDTWSKYPPTMFGDYVHMSPEGRDKFSNELGRALAGELPRLRSHR
jgi:hypothetical protein